MGLLDQIMRVALPIIPKPVIWTVARRYVAGAELEDALARIRTLRSDGFGCILDLLGEAVTSMAESEAAAAEYHRALEVLPSVDDSATISVKPTHMGAMLDREACETLLSGLCERAAEQGRRVRLEMEDAPTIDRTLEVFRSVRARHTNLGCVLQARLFRTADDVAGLLADGGELDVRLVKGIYLEPKEIAWTEDADICRSYRELAEQLVAGGAQVAFATHHSELADACVEIARSHGLVEGEAATRRYEFQLLMGVRKDEAQRLAEAGHRVLIYVPYGRDWHAYTQRRLARNPEIARHVMRAMFSRG